MFSTLKPTTIPHTHSLEQHMYPNAGRCVQPVPWNATHSHENSFVQQFSIRGPREALRGAIVVMNANKRKRNQISGNENEQKRVSGNCS